MIQPTQRLVKTKRAAELLSMSKATFRRYVHDGEIPFLALGKNGQDWWFDVRDLDKFIDSHKEINA